MEGYDLLVASYTPSGVLRWAQTAGGTVQTGRPEEADIGHGIATDGTNVYVTGQFWSSPARFDSYTLATKGESDLFVASMSCANGQYNWVAEAHSSRFDVGVSIVLGEPGYLYAAGLQGYGGFATTFGTITTSVNPGLWGGYVAKMNINTGQWLWVNTQTSQSAPYHTNSNIAFDSAAQVLYNLGNTDDDVLVRTPFSSAFASVLTPGSCCGDWYITAYKKNGEFAWTGTPVKIYNTPAADENANQLLFYNNHIYAMAYFSGNSTLGSFTLNSKGNIDLAIAKFDRQGNITNYFSGGGTAADGAISGAFDNNGNLFLCGLFNGSATFGSVTTSHPGQNGMILRYGDTTGCFQPEPEPEDSAIAQLFIPNTFTPNHDGLNDIFLGDVPGDVKSFDLQIYNRWGELVFKTTAAEQGWDGTYMDNNCPQSVYYWLLKANINDQNLKRSGTLTLLR